MRKVQAEPGMAPGRDGDGALVHDNEGQLVWVETTQRWVGTGRTVFDNKGNPIKQYEPFFSGTYEYEEEAELVEWGVTPILRYDGLGRLTRTDLPNGTYSKVEFDPWKETRYDPNDTVADSLWYASRASLPTDHPERQAADKAYLHRNTPSVVHLDALGRPFKTIEDNGAAGQYATTVELDIEGNTLSITDHREVIVQESMFAMGGVKLWQKSCDAGERWMLGDVGGALLRAWDQRGFTRRAQYDGGRRPTHLWVQPGSASEILVERTVYGELLDTAAAASNLRGKPYLHHDGAGVVQSVAFDFKGNLLESRRRLATEYQSQLDWSALAALTDPAAITAAAEAMLEAELFTAHTAYDALNRPVSLTAPDSSEIRPGYNEAGLLERVDVRVRGAATWTAFVDDIDYDAKGQREQIVYGAGATTTKYTYDPLTFRLTQLKTTRAAGLPGEQDDDVLQNLGYTYDPVGNITEIHDSAQRQVFFNHDVVLPTAAYTYDALYRLISASGRELTAITAYVPDLDDIPVNLPHANDAQAVRNYTQEYEYDAVGNILRMIHKVGATPEWTRRYKYDSVTDPVTQEETVISNRLVATSAFADTNDFSAHYTYDAHGNMTSMPHLESIEWNHRDEMVSADKGGGGMVYFTYDAAGERVRKVYEHSGLIEERIYLGGFEVYRKWQAPTPSTPKVLKLERETLHVMDGVRRIALVETKTVDTSIPAFVATTVTRLQLGNHLGSAALEVDLTGLVISYEEYHPYGTTAYHSATSAVEVSRKRYRYTGKERDEETGLYYHGARYYAPWLGRWTAADPAGLVDGPNLYHSCADNPVVYHDPTGQAPNATTAQENAHPLPPEHLRPRPFSWETALLPSDRQQVHDSSLNGNQRTALELRRSGMRGLAEVAESGGCAYCHLTKDSSTLAEADKKIDAAHYRGMSTALRVAREVLSLAVLRATLPSEAASRLPQKAPPKPPPPPPPPPKGETPQPPPTRPPAPPGGGTAGFVDPQLDANIVSALLRPNDPNHAAAIAYANANKAAGLTINRHTYKKLLEAFSKDQLKQLRAQYGIKLIRDIDLDQVSATAQRLEAAFHGTGRKLSAEDARVAASAHLTGEKLATNDLQFFKRARDLGLNVEYVGQGSAAAKAAAYVPQPVKVPQ